MHNPPVEHPTEPEPSGEVHPLASAAREALPALSALYRLRAPAPDAHTLGVLYDGPRLSPLDRWQVIQRLAAALHPAERPEQGPADIELVDLCTLEPLRQLTLLASATRLWARDVTADLYEANLRSQKGPAQAHRLKFLDELRALQRTPPEPADPVA